MSKRITLKDPPDLSDFVYKELEGDRGVWISPRGEIYNPYTKRFFKGGLNTQGYVSTSIFRKRYFVHRLLAEVFIPNPENLPQVNHKDMDRSNNDLSNLEWCTNGQNVKHSYDNNISRKTVLPGKARPPKLEHDQVLQIVYLVESGDFSKSEISRMFGVDPKTITNIMKGIVHRHITGFTKEDT